MGFVPRQRDLWLIYIAQSVIGEEPKDYPDIDDNAAVRHRALSPAVR